MDMNQIISAIKLLPKGITLYSGATEDQITWFEAKMGIALPSELREFYQFSNGFDSEEGSLRILSLQEILKDRIASHWKDLNSNQFYFAEYLLYCDMWGVEIKVDEPTAYFIFDSLKTHITTSFEEFLSRFLSKGLFEDGGLIDWGEDKRSMSSSV